MKSFFRRIDEVNSVEAEAPGVAGSPRAADEVYVDTEA